jgi:hypothetical protein
LGVTGGISERRLYRNDSRRRNRLFIGVTGGISERRLYRNDSRRQNRLLVGRTELEKGEDVDPNMLTV